MILQGEKLSLHKLETKDLIEIYAMSRWRS